MNSTPGNTHIADAWLIEKTASALDSIAKMVDWLKEKDIPVSDIEAERIEGLLGNAISKLILILTEEERAGAIREHHWTKLIMTEGSDRVKDFKDYLYGNIAADVPPHKYSPQFRRRFERLDDLENLLQTEHDVRAVLREKILAFARSENQTPKLASALLKVVDDQAYYIRISWEELIARVRDLVQIERIRQEKLWAASLKPLFGTESS